MVPEVEVVPHPRAKKMPLKIAALGDETRSRQQPENRGRRPGQAGVTGSQAMVFTGVSPLDYLTIKDLLGQMDRL